MVARAAFFTYNENLYFKTPVIHHATGSIRNKMDPRQVKKTGKAINEILLKDWDPIGIYQAGPDDEYDFIIWEIFKLIREGGDRNQVEAFLIQAEEDLTGTRSKGNASAKIAAEKLMGLNME